MKKPKKDVRVCTRPSPDSAQFVRMMEALAAYKEDGTDSDANKAWGQVYRLAHVCFVKPGTNTTACPHPAWEEEFWKVYDEVKSYWGE